MFDSHILDVETVMSDNKEKMCKKSPLQKLNCACSGCFWNYLLAGIILAGMIVSSMVVSGMIVACVIVVGMIVAGLIVEGMIVAGRLVC